LKEMRYSKGKLTKVSDRSFRKFERVKVRTFGLIVSGFESGGRKRSWKPFGDRQGKERS
jgi:hypothetical protein